MANTQKRRCNGDGTIRQRSDGRWEGRYVGTDGKQHSVYGRTKTACREALKRKQAEVTTGIWLEPSKITVADWLDTWLEHYCAHIKVTTLANYKRFVRSYFKPSLGKLKLEKLKAAHIQTMFNSMKLATSSKASIRVALSSALGCAVRFDLIRENPCEKVKLGKASYRQMNIIDRQQFPAFIEAARRETHGDALTLLLMTGIRSGELRGLRWSDFDADAATLTVSQQLAFDGKSMIAQTPKSGKSRTIVLIPDAVELLKRHRLEQAKQRLARGYDWIETDLTRDLIFRKSTGAAYARTTLIGPAARVGEALGLPDLHPHDLRHSYAVAALRAGADVKTVQHNLGHASAKMTMDVYAAYTTDAAQTAAARLSAYWSDAAQTPN